MLLLIQIPKVSSNCPDNANCLKGPLNPRPHGPIFRHNGHMIPLLYHHNHGLNLRMSFAVSFSFDDWRSYVLKHFFIHFGVSYTLLATDSRLPISGITQRPSHLTCKQVSFLHVLIHDTLSSALENKPTNSFG